MPAPYDLTPTVANIPGNLALGSAQGALMRKNAKDKASQEALPGLLQSYKSGDQGALLQIANADPEMAKTIMNMEQNKQQASYQNASVGVAQGQLGIQQAQERRAAAENARALIAQRDALSLQGLINIRDSISGVESDEEATRNVRLSIKHIEENGINGTRFDDPQSKENFALLKSKPPDHLRQSLDMAIKHYSIGKMPEKPTEVGAGASMVVKQPDGSYKSVFTAPDKEDKGNAIKGEGELRKEFEGLNKDFREQQRAYTRIQKSVEAPSAAGDVALVFNFMKMLDPGSTVREGEYATAKNAAGVPAIIQAQWNKLKDGESLAPTQRADFSKRAGLLYDGATEGFNKNVERYQGLATQYGYGPGRIAESVEMKKSGAPEKGDVVDNHVFVGGDPNKTESWKELK